jgi:hypothetical protein
MGQKRETATSVDALILILGSDHLAADRAQTQHLLASGECGMAETLRCIKAKALKLKEEARNDIRAAGA